MSWAEPRRFRNPWLPLLAALAFVAAAGSSFYSGLSRELRRPEEVTGARVVLLAETRPQVWEPITDLVEAAPPAKPARSARASPRPAVVEEPAAAAAVGVAGADAASLGPVEPPNPAEAPSGEIPPEPFADPTFEPGAPWAEPPVAPYEH